MANKNGWRNVLLAILGSAILSGGGATLVVGAGKADAADVEKIEAAVAAIRDDNQRTREEVTEIRTRQEAIKESVTEIKEDVKEVLRRLP